MFLHEYFPYKSKSTFTIAMVLFVFSFCLFGRGFAQINTKQLGSWVMFFNQTRLHTKWSIHSEIQFRSYDVQPNTEQLLMRGGINFHYNPNIILSAGCGWITNYADDGGIIKSQTVTEKRLWEQGILKNNSGRLFFEHRYRFEQRWIETATTNSYKNRIRYLLRMTIPINKKEMGKNTLFLSVYDEIFLHLNKNSWDRNRLYGALGFQFSPSVNLQIGYLQQIVGIQSKQYLQVGLNYNPDLRKAK